MYIHTRAMADGNLKILSASELFPCCVIVLKMVLIVSWILVLIFELGLSYIFCKDTDSKHFRIGGLLRSVIFYSLFS